MKKFPIILLHVCYWLMYFFLLIILVSSLNHHGIRFPNLITTFFWTPFGVAFIVPALIGFYSYYSILFNKYLAKKKILAFFLAAILVALIAPPITQIIMYGLLPQKIDSSPNTLFFSGLFLAFLSIVNGILGLIMKGFFTWYSEIKVKVELTKKNHETELALMKAQINPHFLFNTLNNIDVLIQKDAIKASEYLNKLSDIMRFMLYETKNEKITLAKELSYIEKYIELQKIRTSNNNYIKFEVKGDCGNLLIEPMLFIPFIENAFKHAENKKTENAIQILFVIEKNKILFECENAYSANSTTKPEHGGLGNELIQRRLELLYPNQHKFEKDDENGIYKVSLSLHF